VNLSGSYTYQRKVWLFKDITFGAQYTLGKELIDTDSLEVAILGRMQLGKRFELPLFFKAHFGPMETLSNYTRSVNNFGVGIALSF
jgi:hypothetical protein